MIPREIRERIPKGTRKEIPGEEISGNIFGETSEEILLEILKFREEITE